MSKSQPKIISCSANPKLTDDICNILKLKAINNNLTQFNDKELFVEIEESIRGDDVFIIQPTSLPANDHLMELLITIDALKRGSAGKITAIMPYYGYARQDRKTGSRTPISAKLVANLLTTAGANRIVTIDLHASQIQGFFDIPVDNLFANSLIVDHIKNNFDTSSIAIISPDIGGVLRARSVAKWLNCELAIIDKRRPKAGESEALNVIGNVKNMDCIIIDDIADTAGTLCNGSNLLIKNGAKSVSAYVTHGVFSKNAISNITNSPISHFYTTDTISQKQEVLNCPKIEVISAANLLAQTITRIHNNKSVSELFL